MSDKHKYDAGRYYDGEMSVGQQLRFERMLESSENNRAELENMAGLSSLVSTMSEEILNDVSFDGFDKRVLIAVKNDRQPLSLSEKMVTFAKEFFAYKKIVWIPAGAVAAAGSLLFAITLSGTSPASIMPDSQAPLIWKASAPLSILSSEAKIVNSTEVKGTEYNISLAPGKNIGVVWIDD